MSIASEIQRLQTAKQNITTAIENKGVQVPANTTLDFYPTYISQIQTQGTYQAKTITPTTISQTVLPDARI